MSEFQAFRYKNDQLTGHLFTAAFLSSHDFDGYLLSQICKDLGIAQNGAKNEVVNRILSCPEDEYTPIIARHLIRRTKTAWTFKLVQATGLGLGADPVQLIDEPGSEIWYGPMTREGDAGANWYIRPFFIPYEEKIRNEQTGDTEIVEFTIRWLCFARVKNSLVSVHWHGFSFPKVSQKGRLTNSQFAYWEYIPNLFNELETLFKGKCQDIRVVYLVLFTLLDKYRRNSNYKWSDNRVRGEAGGVSFNTRVGSENRRGEPESDADDDTSDLAGIRYLATSIRKAVQAKLKTDSIALPEPEEYDDAILMMLIRNYGTIAYELRLANSDNQLLFHVNCYFGAKAGSNTADSFPHFQIKNTRYSSDINQLEFLISHFDKGKHVE